MKTLMGYRTLNRNPIEGDLIYSLKWQKISTARKMSDGELIFSIPGFKGIGHVDGFCMAIEKSAENKIVIKNHGMKIYETIKL